MVAVGLSDHVRGAAVAVPLDRSKQLRRRRDSDELAQCQFRFRASREREPADESDALVCGVEPDDGRVSGLVERVSGVKDYRLSALYMKVDRPGFHNSHHRPAMPVCAGVDVRGDGDSPDLDGSEAGFAQIEGVEGEALYGRLIHQVIVSRRGC